MKICCRQKFLPATKIWFSESWESGDAFCTIERLRNRFCRWCGFLWILAYFGVLEEIVEFSISIVFCNFLITGTGIDSVVISFTGELDNVKNLPSDVVNTCLDTSAGLIGQNANKTWFLGSENAVSGHFKPKSVADRTFYRQQKSKNFKVDLQSFQTHTSTALYLQNSQISDILAKFAKSCQNSGKDRPHPLIPHLEWNMESI